MSVHKVEDVSAGVGVFDYTPTFCAMPAILYGVKPDLGGVL